MTTQSHIQSISVRSTLVLALLLASLGILPSATGLAVVPAVADGGVSELLQATSGGHVLGFQPGAMVVGSDQVVAPLLVSDQVKP